MSEEDYLAGKFLDTGYPGYPATSQADEMWKKSFSPGMYPSTLPPARIPIMTQSR